MKFSFVPTLLLVSLAKECLGGASAPEISVSTTMEYSSLYSTDNDVATSAKDYWKRIHTHSLTSCSSFIFSHVDWPKHGSRKQQTRWYWAIHQVEDFWIVQGLWCRCKFEAILLSFLNQSFENYATIFIMILLILYVLCIFLWCVYLSLLYYREALI